MRYKRTLWILFSLMMILPACAPMIVVGAGAGAVAANDSRSIGSFVDDHAIELKAAAAMSTDNSLRDHTHVSVTSINGIVLLTGEAETTELRDQILKLVRDIQSVRRITNAIRIAPISSLGARAQDSWLTTKVKSRLLATKNLASAHIKVLTDNASVYLMGLVTHDQGDIAAQSASNVGGIERVVKLFEYTD